MQQQQVTQMVAVGAGGKASKIRRRMRCPAGVPCAVGSSLSHGCPEDVLKPSACRLLSVAPRAIIGTGNGLFEDQECVVCGGQKGV